MTERQTLPQRTA